MSAKDSIAYRTHIVEPVYDVANQRAEWRFLPDTCYFADARLLDIGAWSASGATAANGLLGSECPIRAIHLMDGGTTLDTINDFPQWRAIQKLQVQNDGAISVGRHLSKNQVGYIVSGEMSADDATFGQNQDIIVAQDQGDGVATTAAGAHKAWISLKSVFPFLANSAVLPTNVFRQLKLVVQFNSATQMADLVSTTGKTDITSTRGLVVIDELEDSDAKVAAMSKYQGVRWSGVVQDRWQLDAVTAATSPQSVTQKLRGFDGAWVEDLVVKLTPQTVPQTVGGDNKPFGALGSLSVPAANFQVRVNGQNKLPRAGVEGKMRALALATDSIGSICTMPFQVMMSDVFNGNGHGATVSDTQGQVAPFAVEIKDHVEDLQVTLGREFKTNNPIQAAALNINVFGRVAKALVLDQSGGYLVVNASQA